MPTDLGPVLFRLISATHRLSRSATLRLDDGFSASHYRTLGILQDVHAMRIGQLADQSRISQPGMTKIVASLEERKLVGRVMDPTDSRARLIEITDAGRAELSRRGKDLARVLTKDFANLTEEQIAVLAQAADILNTRNVPESGATK